MEYLRSKVAQTDDTMEENEEDADDDDDEDNADEDEDFVSVQHADSDYESGDREKSSKNKLSASDDDKKQKKDKKSAMQEVTVQIHSTVQWRVVLGSASYSIPMSLWCRWSQRQSSQWSWEECRSLLKRWLNIDFLILKMQQ